MQIDINTFVGMLRVFLYSYVHLHSFMNIYIVVTCTGDPLVLGRPALNSRFSCQARSQRRDSAETLDGQGIRMRIPTMRNSSVVVPDTSSGNIYIIIYIYILFICLLLLLLLSSWLLLLHLYIYIIIYIYIWQKFSDMLFWHSTWYILVWHSTLAFYLALLSWLWHPIWGPPVPTEIWNSLLRFGHAHWDLELAVGVRQCPFRSGASAHWNPQLAVEVPIDISSSLFGGGGRKEEAVILIKSKDFTWQARKTQNQYESTSIRRHRVMHRSVD